MSLGQKRQAILDLVRDYAAEQYAPRPFVAGESPVPPSGKVLGAEELVNLVEASLDGWLTTGRFNDAFEKTLRDYLGRKFLLTCNSGSSANLLAVAALTSHTLGMRALKAGDEVITVAAGFPTTVNPLLQYGLVPVFVDVDIPTYNAIPEQVAAAVSGKTRAIMLAHTLGNPFDLGAIKAVAERHNLWLIEDCCDALGSTYQGKLAGTFGDVATFSFYPAHHITMGEGGAVTTDDPVIKRAIESFRDWGRDCWCDPGRDNTCRKRFDQQFGELPVGYDHKYVYSHVGYNLKISDMQAAVGLAQLQRLDGFITARRANFDYLKAGLAGLEQQLILPEATVKSVPAWFGFPITVRADSGIKRVELTRHLDTQRVGTRMLFAGNLTRQPYMLNQKFRRHSDLNQANTVMEQSFWIGCYPGLSPDMLDHVIEQIRAFCTGRV